MAFSACSLSPVRGTFLWRNCTNGSRSPDMEWLEVLQEEGEPPARPPWRAPQWRVPPGQSATRWVPEHDSFMTATTRQPTRHWPSARKLGHQPHEQGELQGVCRRRHNPPATFFRLACGGRQIGDGDGPGRPWPSVGTFPALQRRHPGWTRTTRGSMADVEETPHPQDPVAPALTSRPDGPPAAARHIRQCGTGKPGSPDGTARRSLCIVPPPAPALLPPPTPRFSQKLRPLPRTGLRGFR